MTKAKEKVDECLEQVERSDAEVDSLTAKLDRRTRLFDEERKLYYKEFLMLREMVRRAGLLEENSALLKSFEGVWQPQSRTQHKPFKLTDTPHCGHRVSQSLSRPSFTHPLITLLHLYWLLLQALRPTWLPE